MLIIWSSLVRFFFDIIKIMYTYVHTQEIVQVCDSTIVADLNELVYQLDASTFHS